MYLTKNLDETNEIGKLGRSWIEQYWSDNFLVSHFISVYNELLQSPESIERQASLKLDNPRTYFYSVIIPELQYTSRKRRYLSKFPIYYKLISNFKQKINQMLISLRSYINPVIPIRLKNKIKIFLRIQKSDL